MDALDLDDLTFGYGRAPAVRGVSLTVAPGDCYGFLGHNGAGKTTVMRLVLGLLRPRRGSVRVFGVDAVRAGERARGLVGALIERPGFHLRASAVANLASLARLQGVERAGARREAERVLELAGLAAAARARVGTFSLGMRQRLGIAAALLGRPRLLLLDEPTSGLDPEGIAALRAWLQMLTRDERVAVLLSSHQLAELEGLCNRVGVLRDGAMVVEGSIHALRQRLGLRHVVAGEPLAALERRLVGLGLAPARSGDRLLVELGGRAPGAVVRELAAAGEVSTFAPEPATLEAIYLQAHTLAPVAGNGAPAPTAGATRDAAPGGALHGSLDGALVGSTDGSIDGAAAANPAAKNVSPMPAAVVASAAPASRATEAARDAGAAPVLGTTRRPLARALGHELRTVLGRRSTLPLLAVPAAVAAWRVLAYDAQVERNLARVRAGELFSADGGSGPLACAIALQTATPVLALVLLWFSSQSIAADLAGDTLRNTLLRSVRRVDVAFGKLGAHVVLALVGLVLLWLAAAGTAIAVAGWGDLAEISRHGDHQVLAYVDDLGPAVRQAAWSGVLPLLAVAATGLLASVLAKRPARALCLAVLLAVLPEVVRDRAPSTAGWLLTTHLPTGWRDDSALGFFAASARGAADAFWPHRATAVLAPLAWLVAAGGLAAWLLRRLRVP